MGVMNVNVGFIVYIGINVVGKFGFGDVNDKGERFIQFCEQINFMIVNTWF